MKFDHLVTISVTLAKAEAARIQRMKNDPILYRVKAVHYVLLAAASFTALVSIWAFVVGASNDEAAISRVYAKGSKVITSPTRYALMLGVVSTMLIFAGYVGPDTMAAPAGPGARGEKVTLATTAMYLFAILTSIPLMLFTAVEAAITLSVAKSATRQAKDLLIVVIATTSISTLSGSLAAASGSFECLFGAPRE